MPRYHQPDYILIFILGLIIIFGLVMLSSASSPLGYEKFSDSYYYLKHQILFGLLPGFIALYFFSKIDYSRLRRFAFPLLLFSILLLIAVFIPGLGATYGKAKSWLNIFGVSLQPAEITKLTFLIYLATWLERRGAKGVKDIATGLIPFLLLLGLITVLIILEPDIGTMSVIALISLVVYFVAGGAILHLIWIGTLGLAFLVFLIQAAPYRTARFMTFLHPELDPQGIGYHINQALLAIGSGGLFGLGLGHSRQKFQYLPEVAGDSIFAIMAEELGFILTLAVVALFLLLMYRGFKIARGSPNLFGKLLAVGITSWFVFQAFINMGSMVGLLPMTGIPLPFISYGGTALFISLAAAGILINISKQTS